MYAPNEDDTALSKDKFWEELTVTTENCQDNIFVLGDFNSRVGRTDNKTANVLGKYGEEKINNNGKRMLQYCTLNDLIISNTFYKHRDIHKYTRTSEKRKENSIIDYILVQSNNRRFITDVRVFRSAEIFSDHYLVIAKVKGKAQNTRQENGGKINITKNESIRTYKLREDETLEKYIEIITQEAEQVERYMSNKNVEEAWQTFKEIILKAAKQACGTIKLNPNKKQTAWWNESIKEEIRQKKQKWKKYLKSRTEENYNEYKTQRIKVKNAISEAKNKSWEDFGRDIEKNKKENRKLFYRIAKTLRKGKQEPSPIIKSKEGTLLKDNKEIMKRWNEHFRELLNTNKNNEENNTEEKNENRSLENTENTPTIEEVTEAIKHIKRGKAPGHDGINPDMLKQIGNKGTKLLHEVIKKAWAEERIPEDWNIGVIIPIYKKGDKKNCGNYRGITLLSTVLKIYERILEKRLRTHIEQHLSTSQSGFRRGCSTQDHVFTIKEITHKTISQGKEAYLAFLDLEKAFDSVSQQKIWESLNKRGVNSKLLRTIKSLYKNNTSYVRKQNWRSDIFDTNKGLRQGGVMSPLLFIILMDDVIKQTAEKTKKLEVGYRKLHRTVVSECAFADDVVVLAKTEKDLQHNLDLWTEALQDRRLKINIQKTKVMTISKEERTINIKINGKQVEQVNEFKYLGVVLHNKGKQESDITERADKAIKAYYSLCNSLVKKKEISRQTKLLVYKTILLPILTHGSETWILTETMKNKIQAVEMKYLRAVKGVTKLDRIRNQTIREELEVTSVLDIIKEKQLGWWGHLQRLEDNKPVKQVWETKIIHKRSRGRPYKTWDQVIGKILKEKKTDWGKAKQIAQNKEEWRKFIGKN